MPRKPHYVIEFTSRSERFPYNVTDLNRYGGDVIAQCRSRRLAGLLIAALEAAQSGSSIPPQEAP